MDLLEDLLPNARRAGVYHSQVDSAKVVAAAKAAGLLVFKLDLTKVRDKKSLLELVAKALKFPRHFGRNWDAVHDCLGDLSWHDGHGWVLLLRNADTLSATDHEAFETFLRVSASAAEYWHGKGQPFWVIVEGKAGWEPGLPKLASQ